MNDSLDQLDNQWLLAVEKPSRYTGGEVNARRAKAAPGALRFALAFPDTYEVGMSHLGLQILYAVLNRLDGVVGERCYAPWPDMEQALKRRGLPLTTLEFQTPLKHCDVVGFSLQYELSYTNVLAMLDLGGIPLHRGERREGDPLVLAGGPSCFNPAPMSPFIDAFVIGEGEDVIAEVASAVLAIKKGGGGRADKVQALAAIPGVYVPGLHGEGACIVKRIVTDLDAWRLPHCPIVPLMRTIHDRITLEVARGCTRGCRFCQAGMVWRPVRERSPAILEGMAEAMLQTTGYDEISLLSLSSGDYSHIEPLLTTLMKRYYTQRVALALPSLRAETLTPAMIDTIRQVRKTSFTLAPEAGTQRLRNVINKGNTEDELLATTERVFAAGWKAVKLYFMIGLPTEGQEDLEGICDLAYKVLKTARNRGQVTVSLSTFVPKPHTPFQWQRQIGLTETVDRQALFKQRLKHRHLSVKWHDARMSFLEGLFSRGGSETGALIEAAYRLGCRFDGWSDRLRFDLWEKVFSQAGIDPATYLRARAKEEPLPWDMIASGVSREFLLAEAIRADRGEATPDCRDGICSACGVCDHRTVRPVLISADAAVGTLVSTYALPDLDSRLEIGLRLRFTKGGPARFLSHLELAAAFSRAMTIGGATFVYSQGYHPHPRISFAGATAVGMESEGEFVDCRIREPRGSISDLITKVNTALPAGVAITAVRKLPPRAFSLAELVTGFNYTLFMLGNPSAEAWSHYEAAIQAFLAAACYEVTRGTGGKRTVKDIRPYVAELSLDRAGHRLHLATRTNPSGTARPTEILSNVLSLSPEELLAVRVVKTGTCLAAIAGEADREIFYQSPDKIY